MKVGQLKELLKECVREVLREEMSYTQNINENFGGNQYIPTPQATQPIQRTARPSYVPKSFQAPQIPRQQRQVVQETYEPVNSDSIFSQLFSEVGDTMTNDDMRYMSDSKHSLDEYED